MIEMIAGVFGLPVKQPGKKTRVVAKGPNDGPFDASPEQEARLVDMGLARYVNEPIAEEKAEADTDAAPIGFDEMPPEDFDGEADTDADDSIIDIATLSAKELRELGKEYGLTFKANASRKAMIEEITAAQAETAEEEPAEDAPAFDAAEAVL